MLYFVGLFPFKKKDFILYLLLYHITRLIYIYIRAMHSLFLLGHVSQTSKVLEEIPVGIAPDSVVYVFVLPSSGGIGSAEDVYDHLEVKMFDSHRKPQEPGKVAYMSSGRLGGLHGGLLRVKDTRKVVSVQDLVEIQEQHVADQIEKSRPCVPHKGNVQS